MADNKVLDDGTKRAGEDTKRAGEDTNRAGDDTNRAGDDINRAGDDTNRTGDDINRASDYTNRAGDDTNRAGDDTNRAGDDINRAGDDANRTSLDKSGQAEADKPDRFSEHESDECEGEGAASAESEEDKDEEEKLLQQRMDREEKLSEEEKMRLRDQAQSLKDGGNREFREQSYAESIEHYTEALSMCPLCFKKERSVMYSNRAAARDHMSDTHLVIHDCSSSIELDPSYIKPILRRAQAYEKVDKLDEALADYKTLLDLEYRPAEVTSACQRLPKQIEEKNEKLKNEMLGKLKEVGNLFLRPFGISTDNFKLQQNESGGYSVNFTNS